MENRDQKKKVEKEQEQPSPYQELYGKKEEDTATESGAEERALDSAGAFGSAASKPGPESGSKSERPGRIQSEDGSDRDGEQREND